MPMNSITNVSRKVPNNAPILDKLHQILDKSGITDENILGGVQLSETGLSKLAAKLNITTDEVYLLFNSLVTKLRKDNERFDEMANNDRYSLEDDYLDNITVRDGDTGKEIFLRGDRANNLRQALKMNPDKQTILRRYFSLNEDSPQDERHRDTLAKTGFFGKQGAGCIILALSTNKILIPHRSKEVEQPFTWGTWGGAIDDGEQPEHAVRREVGEEAGYHGMIKQIIPLYKFKSNSFEYFNFLVVIDEEFEPTLNWETDDYKWCDFGHWPAPLHFGLKSLLNDSTSLEKIKNVIEAHAHPLEESAESDDDFEEEMRSNVGSYNFPWRHSGMHGFATARFQKRMNDLKVTVINVRDSEGEVIDASPFMGEVHKQAVDFIGDA